MPEIIPKLTVQDVNKISMLGLAHVGDAVYELLFRSKICAEKPMHVTQLHKLTVSRVNAASQAAAAEKILPFLTEEECVIFKRGRNTKVNSVPHHSDLSQYHAATGLEALFGWLFLLGRTDRIGELFAVIAEE